MDEKEDRDKKDSSRDRDRGDRDRGDRDRDRSDRDRGDRDRDRDRGDRDRSDRDRDRDYYRRDRDRSDRDRSDRSDRGDRDRSDRGDRDRSDRGDRDRSDRDRDRNDRDRDRDSYSSSSSSSRKRSRSPPRSSRGDPFTTTPQSRKSSLWDRQPDQESPPSISQQSSNQQGFQSQFTQPNNNNFQQQQQQPSTQQQFYNGYQQPPPPTQSQHQPFNPMFQQQSQQIQPPIQQQQQQLLDPQKKQSRRIYVGNIPPGITDSELIEFFNAAVLAAGLNIKPGPPVVFCQINAPKCFAFVEFRTPEEATNSMKFDGITLKNYTLKIRRPKDYQQTSEGSSNGSSLPTIVPTNVPDSEHKIFVGGLPSNLNEEQVKTLLSAYGKLKAFNLVKDTNTGVSKGFAFCEYVDPEVTDQACARLNGVTLADKSLIVQRASIGSKAALAEKKSSEDPSDGTAAQINEKPIDPAIANLLNLSIPVAQTLSTIRSSNISSPSSSSSSPTISIDNNTKPSRVIQLLNLVDKEDLYDDKEYDNILIDVKEECENYGSVQSIWLPMPSKNPLDVTRVYIEFQQLESAQKACLGLGGKKYNGRTLFSAYYPEDSYYKNSQNINNDINNDYYDESNYQNNYSSEN